MKKMLAILLAAALSLSLAACGNSANEPSSNTAPSLESSQSQEPASIPEESSPSEQEGNVGNENILVAYFSWTDNAILAEDVDAVASPSVIAPGNVQELAAWVQEETGGDLFAIRVTEPDAGIGDSHRTDCHQCPALAESPCAGQLERWMHPGGDP